MQRAAVAIVQDNAILLWAIAPAGDRLSQSGPTSHSSAESVVADERGKDAIDDVFASLAIVCS
jgi:hypothetical protein